MARCPHCDGELPVHSAFVTNRQNIEEELQDHQYHEDKEKRYRTSRKDRKRSLAYYYRNREKVLAREKLRRLQQHKVRTTLADVSRVQPAPASGCEPLAG